MVKHSGMSVEVSIILVPAVVDTVSGDLQELTEPVSGDSKELKDVFTSLDRHWGSWYCKLLFEALWNNSFKVP